MNKYILMSIFILLGFFTECVAIWGYKTSTMFIAFSQSLAIGLGLLGFICFYVAWIIYYETFYD